MSVFNGPITSGVLGTVDKANVSASYFAPSGGGGGGGGGGPNLVCSTLTTNSGNGLYGGVADINPQSANFGIGNSTVTLMNCWGDLAGGEAFQIGATTTAQIDYVFNISSINTQVPPISEEGTFLQVWSDANPATGGCISLGAQPDGTGYVAVTAQTGPPVPSTLFLVADTVKIFPQGDLVVSSINGALPGGALPEDAGFNNLECSTIAANTSVSVGGFTQPIILYGATTLNGSGTASVGLDRQYADPYYPFVCYRGTLGANTSTLSVSTVNADTFNIYGEANTSVQYMVVGN